MTILLGLYIKLNNQIFHFTNMFLTDYTADQYISHVSLKLTMIVYDFFVDLHNLSLLLAERTFFFFIGQTISDSELVFAVLNFCSLSVVWLLITSQESAISLTVYILYVYFPSFLF